MPAMMMLATLLVVVPATLHPTGGLFVDPAEVPWLVEVQPDATAADPPDAVDHSANMPPVGSQGSLPSCTSWAFAYYYKTYQEWLERGWDVTVPAHQFSPAFLYNMANAGGNIGSYYTDNMKLLLDFGCATFADCPNSANPVPWPSESAYARALPYRCEEACYISCGSDPGIVELKSHIAAGDNAVLPINVWANFDNINNFDTCYCSVDRYGTNRGGHYITFVGYDDDRPTNDGAGAFKFVNSWGTGWGNRGYGWMSYEAVKDGQLSYRIGLFLRDRIGYAPRLVARATLAHGAREDVRLDGGIRRNGVPVWQKTFLERDLDRQGAHAFPAHPVPLDLTDAAELLEQTDTSCVFIEGRDVRMDGVTGELTGLAAVDIERGALGTAGVVYVPIPDDGTGAGATLALPGQQLHWPGFGRFPDHHAAIALSAELDTLRDAGSFVTGGAVSGAPVLGDLDSDGRNEVVFGSADGTLRAVNGNDLSILWCDSLGSAVSSAPAIGDLDSDGGLDVAAGWADGTVRAYDGATGAPLWTYTAGAAPTGGLVIADPDVDGRLEVILGTDAGRVVVLDGELGTEQWGVTLPGGVTGAPALGDLDSDGRQEVVVGCADSLWRVFDARTGEFERTGPAGAAASSPTLADLDADGRLELIVGAAGGTLSVFTGDSGAVVWQFAARGPATAAAVGDANGDGSPDVVFGSEDSSVYALDCGGVLLWTRALGGKVRGAPALGLVNSDSALDVIVGADDGKVYVLDGISGATIVTRSTGGPTGSAAALGDIFGTGRL
ncbi:MAG: PQQ-binding-like beta-propeller repeat protein, partial [bacterium]